MPGRRPAAQHGFYEEVLDQTRRATLRAARAIDGLDEDVALLRSIARAELAEAVADRSHVLRTLALVCQAELARARISGRSGNDLYKSVMAVLHDVGGLLEPSPLPPGEGEGQDPKHLRNL